MYVKFILKCTKNSLIVGEVGKGLIKGGGGTCLGWRMIIHIEGTTLTVTISRL